MNRNEGVEVKDSNILEKDWFYKEMNFYKNNGSQRKVKVAIVDSGINIKEFPDFLIFEKEFTEKRENNNATLEHGTSIAGIILVNNIFEKRLKPLIEDMEVYSAKVVSDVNNGVMVDDFVKAIEWSIDNKVDVINISLGFKQDHAEVRSVVQKAIQNDIIIVASSGNNFGLNADYPARYPEVLSVGAVDESLNILPFNSHGKIDYVAPGENIISISSIGGKKVYEGTSVATAFVTRLIVLKLSENKDKLISRYSIIQKYLLENSIKLGNKETYGNGLPIYMRRGENE